MIRILHSSDWHLGKTLFAKSMLDDQRGALHEFSEQIRKERPQLVILAGDLFDRSVPPEEAVALYNQFLDEIVKETATPIALIPGNHDSNERVGIHAGLLRGSGLHIFATPNSVFDPLCLENDGTKVAVYGIPYLEPTEWGFFFGETLRSHEEALVRILEALSPQLEQDRTSGVRTVLILHAYLTGGEASESERPLSIGGSDLIPSALLKDFDYVALGHLHRPQTVGSERIRYPGSLLSYSASEASQDKGFVRIDLATNAAEDAITFQAFQSVRKLRVLTGTLDELLLRPPTDDSVIANLTDPVLPFEAFRKLQRIFPQLLHIGREIQWSREGAENAQTVSIAQERSDQDVLSDFLREASPQELDAPDRDWLLQELEAFHRDERAGDGAKS